VPAEELTERPPLVEVTPGHFVEACPRCANL
jgi:peptide/nickel transport system ATP-binding protein